MKKLLSILLAALPIVGMAQSQITVTVDSAGKLSKKIDDKTKYQIAELTVSGPINGSDLKLIQQIVNRSKAKEKAG